MAPQAVCVVGCMSSGNRLLRDVIEPCGLLTWVDISHGTTDVDVVDTLVLVIVRHEYAVRASFAARWAGHEVAVPIDDSLEGIAKRYPDAERVSYEALCADPDATIVRVAELLELAPWPCLVVVINRNAQWAGGKP